MPFRRQSSSANYNAPPKTTTLVSQTVLLQRHVQHLREKHIARKLARYTADVACRQTSNYTSHGVKRVHDYFHSRMEFAEVPLSINASQSKTHGMVSFQTLSMTNGNKSFAGRSNAFVHDFFLGRNQSGAQKCGGNENEKKR